MRKVIAIRHGESRANTDDELVKWDYANYLTEVGMRQAFECGQSVKEILGTRRHDVHVITSTLPRAHHTAMVICSVIQHANPLIMAQMLREMMYQADTGYVHKRDMDVMFGAGFVKVLKDDVNAKAFQDGETQLDVYERVSHYVKTRVVHELERHDVVLVSHFYVLRAIHCMLSGLPPGKMPEFNPRNATPYVYDIEDLDKLR